MKFTSQSKFPFCAGDFAAVVWISLVWEEWFLV
jgi:hypothetical protein